jgi:DNA-directed RNA polymerase I subunit RPA1
MKQSDENDYDEPESEEERENAESDKDSDDDIDLTKVKLEVDEEFDTSKLEQLVTKDENADLKQLNELEKKEEEDEEEDTFENEIVQNVMRKIAVISSNIDIKDFEYDRKKHLWCIVKFEMPVKFKNIDMTNVLRDAARTSVIWEIPKLKRAITFKQNDLLYIKTEGINIQVSRNFSKIKKIIYFFHLKFFQYFHRPCLSLIKF